MKRLHARRRGLTLVELVLALGLLSLLMVVVFQLLDRTLSLWRRVETRRSVLEQSSVITDLIAHDLRALENGERGDCVAEWVTFDPDGDGVAETKWPRLRVVRQASAREIARILEHERAGRRARTGERASDASVGATVDEPIEIAKPGLVEAVWLVAPASLTDRNARAEGVLWRGERRADDATTKSFFAPDFFGASNRPPAGATDEVSGGVLWLSLSFATQASDLDAGWTLTHEVDGVAAAWDAWARGRPDADVHPWNERAGWMPEAKRIPLLPRRVQVEIEIERPIDRQRRTTLTKVLETEENALQVDDGERVPLPESYVLVDAEWMRVTAVNGRDVSVQRAQRGTKNVTHAVGALVHHGQRLVREVPIALHREDWDL